MTKDRTSSVARADSDGASTMDLSGRCVGNSYVLQRPIGQGATGTVWRGVDRASGEPVAVKLLHESLLRQPRLVTRFVQERTILLMLRHRNVVRVRDLFSVGETLGLVMDLVEGGSLRDHLRERHTVPAGEAARLAAQVAAALAEAHELGVIHRDLKPDNVLLRIEDGRLDTRLTDFGIARILNTPSMTTPNAVVGTPHYMAPEAFHGVTASAATDVYALGVLLYELVSGRPPYDSDSIPDLMRRHMEGNPERRRGVPDGIWELITQCMATKPRLRPTAAEMVGELSDAARKFVDVPALARPSTAGASSIDPNKSDLSDMGTSDPGGGDLGMSGRGMADLGMGDLGRSGRGMSGQGLDGRGLDGRGLDGRGLDGRGMDGLGMGDGGMGLAWRERGGSARSGRGVPVQGGSAAAPVGGRRPNIGRGHDDDRRGNGPRADEGGGRRGVGHRAAEPPGDNAGSRASDHAGSCANVHTGSCASDHAGSRANDHTGSRAGDHAGSRANDHASGAGGAAKSSIGPDAAGGDPEAVSLLPLPRQDRRDNAAPRWRWARPGATTTTVIAGAMLAAAVAATGWHYGGNAKANADPGAHPIVAVPTASERQFRETTPGDGPRRAGAAKSVAPSRTAPTDAARLVTSPRVPAKAQAPRVTTTRSPQPEAKPYGPWQCTQSIAFDFVSRLPVAPKPCQMLGRDIQYQASLTAPGGGTGSITVALQDAGSGKIVAGPKTCAGLPFGGDADTQGCGPAAANPAKGHKYVVAVSFRYERGGQTVASTTKGSVFAW